MFHAQKRAAQRLAFVPNFAKLIRVIRAGEAKLVRHGYQERLIYDVPWMKDGIEITVRALVNPEKTVVISVLPSEFRAERHHRKEKQRKKEFFKRFEDDDPVTALRS